MKKTIPDTAKALTACAWVGNDVEQCDDAAAFGRGADRSESAGLDGSQLRHKQMRTIWAHLDSAEPTKRGRNGR